MILKLESYQFVMSVQICSKKVYSIARKALHRNRMKGDMVLSCLNPLIFNRLSNNLEFPTTET